MAEAKAEVRAMRPVNLTRLMDMHASGEKIAAISAFDATFASAAARAGVECILVNEGQDAITLDALAYHVGNVAQGLQRAQLSAWLMSDLPAESFGGNCETAMRHAAMLFTQGAQMLRLKMDENFLPVAFFLTERGIPVCGHMKDMEISRRASAIHAMANSGAKFFVLEGMSDEAVLEVSTALPHCASLGLHSGQKTSGQLLPLDALLGVLGSEFGGIRENYLSQSGSIPTALAAYVADVKAGRSILN